MNKAVRAIIIHDDKLLVMRRNKQRGDYYTLIGGRVDTNETLEQALVREVKEETSLDVIAGSLVFTEEHPEPYNSQYIFLCEVAPFDAMKIHDASEEALLNKHGIDTHEPMWVSQEVFERLPFLTGPLQKAIISALKNGFPSQPLNIG